jgi:hypothetical protein
MSSSSDKLPVKTKIVQTAAGNPAHSLRTQPLSDHHKILKSIQTAGVPKSLHKTFK